jgi:hypothetical protein
MIRPAAFGYNHETASSNSFQQNNTADQVQELALKEFNAFVTLLNKHDIPVRIFEDDTNVIRPDAIFPNNWFSTHENRTIVLYPMEAPNRRIERRAEFITALKNEYGYSTVHDLTHYELFGQYLEGTGSVVFDPTHRLAWSAFSSRTHREVLLDVCERLGYLPVVFSTRDPDGLPIYHTNVILSLHEKLAIVCIDCIPEEHDRRTIRRLLSITGRTCVEISMEQLKHFSGNALFVKNRSGRDFIVMSLRGWKSLDAQQQEQLTAIAQPITPSLTTIETVGGGSARCMLAELI